MKNAYASYSTRRTSQRDAIPGRESEMAENNAGGFAFTISNWDRLNRFLILGSDAPTYYTSAKKLTKRNAQSVLACIAEDGKRVVDTIVDVSVKGRAPRNDAALFALAMCAGEGDADTKKYALSKLAEVARIGTHLFHFLTYVQNFRGWGRGLREGIAHWYNDKPAGRLAYQLVKYRQRDGWTHRDVLRLCHAKPVDAEHLYLYHWVVKHSEDMDYQYTTHDDNDSLKLIGGYEKAQQVKTAKEVTALIRDYGLTREMIPTEFLKSATVWDSLLEKMPLTAMVRNLGNMSKVGLLVAGKWDAINTVTERLENEEYLHKARIHPLNVLAAMNTYAQGHGFRGKSTWNPVSQVVDALDSAFYKSFGNVEPTRKNIVLALDVSSSMRSPELSGVAGVTPRIGSAAMAMVAARTDRNIMLGFHHEIQPLKISPRQRLDDVVKSISGLPFGRTDCALPMLWAIENKCEGIDAFQVYTDSETWCGNIHPMQALDDYRRKFNPDARLVVVGMTSTGFSIADPKDNKALDVVGFDTAAPSVISSFVRGEF